MPSASFRFYGGLNDFLPALQRQATLVCAFARGASIKDVVEALGVPHTEIDWLAVDGQPVDFSYAVRHADRVAAYPAMSLLDAASPGHLGPRAHDEPRFVADVHLGRLVAYLRFAGFDTAYRNDASDADLVAASTREDRTVLTRDVGVLKHGALQRGYFVRETAPARQLVEVLRRFDLPDRIAPFTRCARCNATLGTVPKIDVLDRIPPRTRELHDDFWQCTHCGRIYWRGSHYQRITAFLTAALEAAGAGRHAAPARAGE